LASYLLFTGATGLLGRYLVGDLLESGNRLALLVRGSKNETASDRVEAILQLRERETGRQLPRPVVLEGDICKPLLGLSTSELSWVRRNCFAAMHSAASLKFHADGTGEPWTSNVEGVRNMLELCEAANLRKLHHVSTAYVCGLREGVAYESELDCGQTFRNEYEESKLQAEKLVRAAQFVDQLTVYRPAVISGDSNTGYTNTYHGLYLYLRMMSLLVPRQPVGPDGLRNTPLRVAQTGDERRNVVPVDWVSKAMTRLYNNPEAHGHTFNLAPDECLTPRQIMEAGYTYFKSKGVEFLGPEYKPETYNEFEAETFPGLAMYNNYEKTDPTFDCTNLKRFAGDIPCPKIDEKMLHAYIRFGEADRWGKRRPTRWVVPYLSNEYFSLFPPSSESERFKSTVAIDLIGPGGGQWTLGLLEDGTLQSERGLNATADSLIKLSMSEFKGMLQEPFTNVQKHAIQQFFPISFSEPAKQRVSANRETANG
jgi:thioester reductase-like protein